MKRIPTVFLDKLGERLEYERIGVQLYDALLAKVAAASSVAGGPTRAQLEHIRDEELRHMLLVRDAIRQIGADPGATTPSAAFAGTAALGWVHVLDDPHTTLTQCLEVMLFLEDGDTEGWKLLEEMATALQLDDLAIKLGAAAEVEREHAIKVRRWLSAVLLDRLDTAAP